MFSRGVLPAMSKRPKKSIIENFGGGVNNDLAGIYLPSGFVPESLNVDFSIERGAARKRMGYQRKNSSALDSGKDVTGIFQARIKGTWVQVVCAGTDVFDWDKAVTFTSKKGAQTFTDDKNVLWDFAVARTTTDGEVIILTNGSDQIQKYDGTTLSAISITEGYNYFKAKYVASFNNYCLFANTNEGANLADDWVQVGATAEWSYTNTDTAFDSSLVIAEVYDGTTQLTEGTVTSLSENQYGVYGTTLYVRVTGGGDPEGTIHITYRCPERIRWMDLGNAEGYTAAQFLDVVTEFGQGIVRILPMRDLLMIYKEDSIWALYATGDAEAPFGIYCIDHNTPCYAGFSVADVKGEHFFLGEEGIMKTNGAKVDPVLISQDVPKWFSRISKDNWKYSYAATNPYLKQYRLLLPNLGSTDASDKDREIRYDYQNNVWSEHSYYSHANVIAAVVNSDAATWNSETVRTWDDIHETWNTIGMEFTRFYTGSYAGFVREHDRTESDTEATAQAINAYFYTKPLNLAEEKEDLDRNKKLLKFRARLKSFTNSDIYVSKKTDNYFFWNLEGTIDCDQINSTGSEIFEGALDVNGVCKEVQWKIANAFAAQPFCVYWILTEYIVRSEK